jgi:hypothetical protein
MPTIGHYPKPAQSYRYLHITFFQHHFSIVQLRLDLVCFPLRYSEESIRNLTYLRILHAQPFHSDEYNCPTRICLTVTIMKISLMSV